MVGVVKVAVESGQVLVVEVALQLYLPDYVLLHLRFSDSLLGHLLENADEPQYFLHCDEDFPEGAFSEFVKEFEVIYSEIALGTDWSASEYRLFFFLRFGLAGARRAVGLGEERWAGQ